MMGVDGAQLARQIGLYAKRDVTSDFGHLGGGYLGSPELEKEDKCSPDTRETVSAMTDNEQFHFCSSTRF